MWLFIPQFVGFIVFMVAAFAETSRPPFDLPEADAELVAGYNTEYGGGRFASYYAAEYFHMVIASGIAVTMFFGGWLLPFGIDPPTWVDPIVVLVKITLVIADLRVGARDAAAPALRPADVARLEGPAAPGHGERARDRDRRDGGRLMARHARDQALGADRRRRDRRAARARARRRRRPLPRVRRDAARAEDDVRAPRRGHRYVYQYPEEKIPVYPRFRGRHKLHRFEDTGLEKCVGCSLCAAACPADCIRVVAAENTPEQRVSAGERYAAVYEINMSRCIFCGYCEVACPFDAITMGHDFELSDYNRDDLIFTKEMLLAEPLERTPLRTEDE